MTAREKTPRIVTVLASAYDREKIPDPLPGCRRIIVDVLPSGYRIVHIRADRKRCAVFNNVPGADVLGQVDFWLDRWGTTLGYEESPR